MFPTSEQLDEARRRGREAAHASGLAAGDRLGFVTGRHPAADLPAPPDLWRELVGADELPPLPDETEELAQAWRRGVMEAMVEAVRGERPVEPDLHTLAELRAAAPALPARPNGPGAVADSIREGSHGVPAVQERDDAAGGTQPAAPGEGWVRLTPQGSRKLARLLHATGVVLQGFGIVWLVAGIAAGCYYGWRIGTDITSAPGWIVVITLPLSVGFLSVLLGIWGIFPLEWGANAEARAKELQERAVSEREGS